MPHPCASHADHLCEWTRAVLKRGNRPTDFDGHAIDYRLAFFLLQNVYNEGQKEV